jgi:hypothetical protein
MLANGYEKQACTPGAVPAHIFGLTFADAKTLQPYTGPVPSATPPKEMAVIALVTGVNHRVAAYGYRGGSLLERREFSMAGTLEKHPQGDLLIDTGFGRNIAGQFRTMPLMFRAITFYSLWQPACWLRSEIAACHSSDPFALGPRQRPARFSRRGCVGDTAGTRVHQAKWRHHYRSDSVPESSGPRQSGASGTHALTVVPWPGAD